MKLSAAVLDYCECARFEPDVRHSHTTFQGYRNRLQQFQAWCAKEGLGDPTVQQIDYELLRRYYFSIVATGVRPRTQRQHIHALRFIFRYLVRRGLLSEDPTAALKLPKLDAARRELVSDDEVQRLYEAAGRQADQFKSLRDKAVVSVLIFTAIRRQELLDLQQGDVDFNQRVLLVRHGKGDKPREVPLCDEAYADLEAWVALRQRLPAKHKKLFCVDHARPLGESGLAALIRDAAAAAGLKEPGSSNIEDKIKPHTLRHAAATRLLEQGGNLKQVQVWLGHSDLKTTAMYLHADERSIRSIAGLMSFQKSAQEQQPVKQAAESEPDQRRSYFQQRRRAVR